MTLVARELARAGWDVALQGTVVHGPGTPLLPLLLATSAFAALVSTARPWLAAAACIAAAAAVLLDLNGGRSPLRWLLPRQASRTLLLWPLGAPPPPRAHLPGPDGAPLPAGPSGDRPRILLALPARIGERGPHPIGARLALVGAAAVAVGGLLPADLQDPFALGAFALLLSSAIASAVAGGRRSKRAVRRPGTSGLLRQLAGALRDRPLSSCQVALAAVGGLEPWLDPIETLLRNHSPQLPAEQTVVVAWQPGPGPLQARRADGVRGTDPSSPQLLAVVEELGLPTVEPSLLQPGSAGQRARGCGWRAITLTGGGADQEAALRTIERLLRRLDTGAQAGEW
jgi:hypothetical protein